MAITYEPIATTTLGTATHRYHFLVLAVVIQTLIILCFCSGKLMELLDAHLDLMETLLEPNYSNTRIRR
jgi:hypothetical protein